MKQIELVILNEAGLHARPAKVLVNLAKQRGGEDNISAIVAKVNEVPVPDAENIRLSGLEKFLVH